MLITFNTLLEKYKISPKGIIHIGAHHAEECEYYSMGGVSEVLWVEGNPELISQIKANVEMYPKNKVYHKLLSDVDNTKITLNISNYSMASSTLKLDLHSVYYPNVKMDRQIELLSQRFDTFVADEKIEISKYDFINIDIQGAELYALKGFGSLLSDFKYIYTEVNIGHLYESCPLLDEMDEFLKTIGFIRTDLSLTESGWGDAFYMKMDVSEQKYEEKIKESKQLVQNFVIVKPPSSNIGIRVIKKILNKLKFSPASVSNDIVVVQNEEKNLIENLIKKHSGVDSFVLFDVGANVGSYTDTAIELFVKYNCSYFIHIFEPQESAFQKLKMKFSNNKNVAINQLALSDVVGEATLYKDFESSSAASMFERPVFNNASQIEVIHCSTLNDYIKNNGIKKIDLLKIDVEGNEYKVLAGASDFYNIIQNIQFEYGGTYADAEYTLMGVYELLRKHFYIGKLTPQKIEYLPFLDELEDFQYSNFHAKNRLK